jgi:hypothetical protein
VHGQVDGGAYEVSGGTGEYYYGSDDMVRTTRV